MFCVNYEKIKMFPNMNVPQKVCKTINVYVNYYFSYTVINVVHKKYNLHIKFKISSLVIDILLGKLH